jgi:ankyrin repeat protein
LISVCGADVEQRGLYEVPDDHSVHNVTPLWCASVAGKVKVVEVLVKYGADVNSVSVGAQLFAVVELIAY